MLLPIGLQIEALPLSFFFSDVMLCRQKCQFNWRLNRREIQDYMWQGFFRKMFAQPPLR